jgi:hypothetical protein
MYWSQPGAVHDFAASAGLLRRSARATPVIRVRMELVLSLGGASITRCIASWWELH